MRKKLRQRSARLTPEEKQTLLKIFEPEEQQKIRQLVEELRRVRKIDKDGDVSSQLEQISEEQFYYVGDFLIENNWTSDRAKIEALWKYLQFEFS
ncbi:MAG: hypothetical protein WC495_06480 [Patescibacteria group bacterium]|jgi:hypothetical protein